MHNLIRFGIVGRIISIPNMKAWKILFIVFTFVLVGVVATAFNFDNFNTHLEAIDNPFTGEIDYIHTANFSGENLTIDRITTNVNWTDKNLTNVECIVFKSGGKICDSP